MKPGRIGAMLALTLVFAGLPSLRAADVPPPSVESTNTSDTVLRKMSDKLSAARMFSFRVRREIESGLEGGDGLAGNTKIEIHVQRPDKVMARATIPHDVRRLYYDGKQFSLTDEKQNVYSTVPLETSLNGLPSELAKLYGFTPPVSELLITDLYQDLIWRAKSVEYRGIGTIDSGFLGLTHVHCHRIGLMGTSADSELWIGVDDCLPRRWNSIVKRTGGSVEIKLDFSDWNLNAKTQEKDFVFSPKKDAIEIPMMTRADMESAHNKDK